MRNASAALQALVATGRYVPEKDVLIEAVTGADTTALRSYRNYLGQNWIAGLDFSESVDQTIASGTLILAREHEDVSLAPLMEDSLANQFGAGTYAPAIDGGREIEIRVAILPHRQTLATVFPGANAGATTVPVSALPLAAPAGASVLLAGNVATHLTAPAAKGATSITVAPLTGGVAAAKEVLINGALPNEPYDPEKEIYDVGDWIPLLQGVTDKPDWGGRKNEVSVTFRNRLAMLADAQILDPFKVGLPEVLTPVEDVTQQIINHETPGAFTVYTYPEPPGFEIEYGDVAPQYAWDAINALTAQYGGRVQHKQRDGYGDYDLCLVLPERESATPQYTLPPTQYIDIPTINLDRSQVRTIIRVPYVDEDGVPRMVQYPPEGTEADNPQVKKYGPQKMQFASGATKAIRTEAAAMDLLMRSHADVSTPSLPQDVECFTVPWVELDDRILLPANGTHYSTDQVGVVTAVSWSFPRKGGGRMTIRTAEKAKGAYHNYRNLDAQIYGFNANARETPISIPLPALNNFGPTKKTALGVTVGWTPGTLPRVAQVWVYELQVAVPFATAPVPDGETARSAVLTTETEYFIEYPPKGFEKFAYFIPVTSVGREGAPKTAHVLPAEGFPTVSFSSVQGATTLYSDVTLALTDPQGLGGTLRVWLNRALPGDATSTGPGDAYAIIPSTPASVGPSTSFALTAGGNANVLDEVRTHPNLGKIVFAEYINEQGVSSGIQRGYLKGWGDIVDGNGRLKPLAIEGADQVTAAVLNSSHLANTVPIVNPVAALPGTAPYVGYMVTLTTETPRKIYYYTGVPGALWSSVGVTANAVIGTLSAAQIGAGIINASHVGAKVLTVENLTVTEFSNLVQNPRADRQLVGWSGTSALTVVSLAGQGLSAQNGFEYTGAVRAHPTTYTIPVRGGDSYRLAVTASNAANPGNWALVLAVFYYRADGSFLTSAIAATFVSGEGFTTRAGTITIPALAASMHPFVTTTVTPTSGTWRFTDFMVSRATDANLLVDGTVTALKVNAAQFTSADTNPLAVIRLRASNAIPASATSYLDLAATGTGPILKHPKLSLNADGSAVFTGVVTIGAGSTFESGYNPTTKETPTGAQAKADAAQAAAISAAASATSTAVATAKTQVSAIIRATTAPTTRADGTALRTGDTWINTTPGQGDRPSSWNGSTWVGLDTVIGFGRISTPTLSALSVDAGIISAGLLQNAASNPTAAVRLNAGTTLPLTVTRFLDLGATGSAPFLKHEKMSLNANGSAIFTGTLLVDNVDPLSTIEFAQSGSTFAAINAVNTTLGAGVSIGFTNQSLQFHNSGGASLLITNIDALGNQRANLSLGDDLVLAAPTGSLKIGVGGSTVGFFGGSGTTKATVAGSLSGDLEGVVNTLITALSGYSLITDLTTP